MIDEAAKISGISSKDIEMSDQKITSSFLYNIAMGSSYGYGMLEEASNQPLPLTTRVFCAQQEIIRRYATVSIVALLWKCAKKCCGKKNRCGSEADEEE